MQASLGKSELTLPPSLSSSFIDEFTETADKVCEDFGGKMKLEEFDVEQFERLAPSDDEEDDGDEEEDEESDEDFTFAIVRDDESSISAGDVFQNGQIKPIFPLFDQSIHFSGELPYRPLVKKVFVEAEESSPPPPATPVEGIEEEVAGPYCAWSRKVVEASREECKKSNSTGFSKIWRFREMNNRSNSDGRDAFVFLNNNSTPASKKTPEKKASGEAKKTKAADVAGEKVKAKKGGKVKTAASSAHEMHYVKNRAMREEDRRRSYLPYKPELVGFFTNVHGGLSKNVHPF